MDRDDEEPRKEKPGPKNLDDLSIEALNEYIGELKAEIARVHADIAAKEVALLDAQSAFKK